MYCIICGEETEENESMMCPNCRAASSGSENSGTSVHIRSKGSNTEDTVGGGNNGTDDQGSNNGGKKEKGFYWKAVVALSAACIVLAALLLGPLFFGKGKDVPESAESAPEQKAESAEEPKEQQENISSGEAQDQQAAASADQNENRKEEQTEGQKEDRKEEQTEDQKEEKKESTKQYYIPETAKYYNGHHYYIYTDVKSNWSDVIDRCIERGGYPAVINDKYENEELYKYMISMGFDQAFFGLVYDSHADKWVYQLGDSSDFTDWGRNSKGEAEPNNADGSEYNGELDIYMNDGYWNDAHYGSETFTPDGDRYKDLFAYICEWDQ